MLAALYPAVWGLGQLATGALSDRWGRKPFIVGGMLLQAAALAMVAVADAFALWAVAAVLLGAGTAMVYPTLLAAIGDVAHPAWRARSVGIYRLWRDGGFAVGALLAGVLADLYGIRAAVWVVAALTAASGAVVAMRMYERTRARRGCRAELVGVGAEGANARHGHGVGNSPDVPARADRHARQSSDRLEEEHDDCSSRPTRN